MLRPPARNYCERVPTNPHLKDAPKTANRRVHSRQKLSSVAYIDLGPSNGGLVLNLSKTGLALSAAMKLMGDELPKMCFKLPGLDEAIEAQARIVWMSESKKEAGVQFERLPESDARKINEWISAEQGSSTRLGEAAVSHEFATTSPEPPTHEAFLVESEKAEPGHSYQAFKSEAVSAVSASVGSNEHQTGFLGLQGTLGTAFDAPWPRRKWGSSAAAIVIIALVSFGIGVTIERRLHPEPANPLDAKAGMAQAKGEKPSAAAGLPAAEGASAESASPVGPGGMAVTEAAQNSPEVNVGSQPSVSVSARQGIVAKSDNTREEGGKKTSRGADTEQTVGASSMAGRDTPRKGEQRNLQAAGTHLSAAPTIDKKQVASREAEARRSSTPTPDSGSLPRDRTGASTQNEGATAQQGTPLTNAAERPAPALASTPPAAKLVSPSVAISMPPFPSMRIPPELKSQASRAGTSLQMGQLVSHIEPVYPAEAVRQEVAGTVKVHAAIGRDGSVQSVEANGPTLLAEAAMSAVQQWHYKPTFLDGQAIEADEEIVFVFRLSPTKP